MKPIFIRIPQNESSVILDDTIIETPIGDAGVCI